MRSHPSVLALLLLIGGCTTEAITTTAPTSTTTETSATTSIIAPLVECPPIPYRVAVLPSRATGEPAELGSIELDEFTSIGGTRSVFWVDGEGALTVALIRGSLPPRDWPGERGEVTVAGVRAVVGPFDQGQWVAAWFDGLGERCDLYTMVFYPPIDPAEVEAALASITREP